MNPNDLPPVEGNNQQGQTNSNPPAAVPPKEEKNLFQKGLDFLGGAFNAVSEAAYITKKTTENVVNNIKEGEYTKIFQSPSERLNLNQYKDKRVTLSEREQNQMNRLKNLSGGQQASDILGGLLNIGKNYLGFGPSFKTKNDKKEFESNISLFRNRRDEINKKIQGIYDSEEFAEINEFNKSIEKRYLEQKGLSKIEDQNDYQNFAKAEFDKLDAFQQKKFQEQETFRQQKASELLNEQSKIDQEEDQYIETNVEGGKAEYMKFQSEIENQFKSNKTFEISQEIEDDVKKELEPIIAQNAKNYAHIKGFDKVLDEMYEDATNSKHQFLKIAGMDIPNKEELLSLYKDTMEARKKFQVNILNKVAELSQNPEYKDRDNVDLFGKAEAMVWQSTNKEEQNLIRNNDHLSDIIDQENNVQQIKDVNITNIGSIINAGYNSLNAAGNVISQFFNMSYDVEDSQGVPTFVRKDIRNLKYADEAWYNRWASVVTYNPDEIASLFVGMKGADKITKVASKVDKVFDPIRASIKFPSGTANYWIGKTVNGASSVVQKATTSFIEGGISDPIIDTAMGEVGGKNQDALNMITNVVFDTAVIPSLAKGFQVGKKTAVATYNATNTSMNSLMYKYMVDPADKSVVNDFVKGWADKGIQMTEQQANSVLQESAKIYRKTYNEDVIKETFQKPGEFYKFLKTNLDHMEGSKLKNMLTERSIGLEIEDAMNVPKDAMNNVNTIYETAFKDGISPENNKLLLSLFDSQLENVNKFLDGGVYKGNRVESNAQKDPEYIELMKNTKMLISNIKAFSSKSGFNSEIQEATRKVISNLQTINSKFTVIKNQKSVVLRNMSNMNDKLVVNIDDIPAMAGKNWSDILNEGIVTFKKGDEEIQYKLSSKSQEKVHLIGHNHVNKYSDKIKEFIHNNRSKLDIDASGQSLDSMINTVKNILFANGQIELKFAMQAKDLNVANEILGDFAQLVKTIGEDFYGKNTITNINNINKLMDSQALKKYDVEKNGVDVGDLTEFLNNQDGKFNLSHGTFKKKDGTIGASLYMSFGKEFNNPDFNKFITAKYTNKKGVESYNLTGFINKFKEVHKNIIEHGLNPDGTLDLNKGILRARGIIASNQANTLFLDGKLDYNKVKELISTLHIKDQGTVDKVTKMVIDMFGNNIPENNNIIVPMVMNFVFNYIKNKEVIDAFIKSVDKLNVKANEVDALSHLLLYGDESYVKKMAKGFKESKEMVEETARIKEIIDGTIDLDIKIKKENLNVKLIDIEEEIGKIKQFIKQLSDPIQIEDLTNKAKNLLVLKSSVEKQIKDIENLYNDLSETKLIDLYGSYLVSNSKNISADILTGMRQKYKLISDKIKAIKENKEIISKVSDDDYSIIQKAFEEIQEAKQNKDASLFNQIVERYKNNDYGERLNGIFQKLFKDISYVDIKLDIFDEEQLLKDIQNLQGLYNHDYIMNNQNNPIISGIRAFINNSNTNLYPEVSKLFKDYFEIADDLDIEQAFTNSEKFRNFVNSITFTNDNFDKIDVNEIVYQELKKIFGDMVFKTNLEDNVIDKILRKASETKSFIELLKKVQFLTKSDKVFNADYVDGAYVLYQDHKIPQELPLMIHELDEMDSIYLKGIDYNKLSSFVKVDGESVKFNTNDNAYHIIEEFHNTNQSSKYKNAVYTPILGTKDYIFVGTFGDKESFFSFYKPPKEIKIPEGLSRADYSEIVKEIYTYHYAELKGFNDKGNFEEFKKAIQGFKSKEDFQKRVDEWEESLGGKAILPIQNIRKRESALMSARSSFDKVNQPTHTFILEEEIQDEYDDYIKELVDEFFNKEISNEEFIQKYSLEDVHNRLRSIDPDYENFREYNELNYSDAQKISRLKRYLEANYNTGLEDGTSYISNTLFDLRSKINGIKHKLYAFKDHYQGLSNGKAFLGKTLFNRANISLDKPLEKFMSNKKGFDTNPDNIVLIGENSHKLKGSYKKFDKEMYVYLNGQKRRVLGYVEDTNTQMFKNASSDVEKHGDEVSLSSSISVKMPLEYEDEITRIQKEGIDKMINEMLENINDYKITSTAIDDLNTKQRIISSIHEGGMGTVNVFKDKIKMFKDRVIEYIKKPLGEGQSMFIYKSDRRIAKDVIIVHPNSDLLKKAKQNKKAMDGSDKGPYFTIGYRYPVPSIYNLGVYEIKTIYDYKPSDFGEGEIGKKKYKEFVQQYKSMGPEHVVSNPHVTYLKIEGDNDGDHFNFVDVYQDISSVYAKAVLNIPVNDVDASGKKLTIQESILQQREAHNGKIPNQYIVTPQVQKGSDEINKTVRRGAGDLIRSRGIAIQAKNKIAEVASTIRTMYLLDRVFKDIEKNGEQSKYFNEEFGGKTFRKLYEDVYLNNPTYPKNGFGEQFKENSAMILQLALDFGSKDADQFPNDWLEKLLQGLGDYDTSYSLGEIISTAALGFNSFKPSSLSDFILTALGRSNALTKNIDLQILTKYGIKGDKFAKDFNKKFNSVIGARRDLIEYVSQNPLVQKLAAMYENNFDVHIVYDMFLDHPNSKELKKLKEIFDTIPTMKTGKDSHNASGVKRLRYFNYEQGKNIKEMIRQEFDKVSIENAADKTFSSVFDFIDKMRESKDKYTIQKQFIQNMNKLSQKDRTIITFYLAALGEQNLFNYLSEKDQIKFLIGSESIGTGRLKIFQRQNKHLLPEMNVNLTEKEFEKELNNLLKDTEKELMMIKKDQPNVSIPINEGNIYELELYRDMLKEKAQEIQNISEKTFIQDESKFVHEQIEVPKLNIPDVTTRQVLAHPHALEELMSENINVVSLARDGVKMTMQSLFTKYMPSLVTTFDAIQNFMNKDPQRTLDFANRVHVQQFGDTMIFGAIGNKKSIYQFLKREGKTQEEIDNISRLIQKEFLFTKDGKYYVNSTSIVKKNLTALFEHLEMRNLTEDSDFMKQVDEYQSKVMIPLIQSMRQMQELMGFDFVQAYKNVDFSIVNDMFAAMKGDPQVALKLHGIDNEAQFMEQLQDSADKMGVRITNFVKKSMRDVVFKQKLSWYEQIIGFLQSLHYNFTYGTGATFLHGGNIIAGLAQVLPNYTELRAYATANMEDMATALRTMDKFNLMKMEDQLKFGTGHGKNLRPDWAEKYIGALTKGTTEGALQGLNKALHVISNGKLNIKDETIMRAGEHVDGFINNILGWNDNPLDNMRKITAVIEQARALGVNIKDLDDYLESIGELGVQKFNQMVHMRYVNSGGGAVSSSPIGRGTLIEHAHNLVDNYIGHHLLKFFVRSNSYLMGWAFHKVSHFVEKEAAIGTAMKRLFQGDVKGFSAHLDDWIAYNSMAMKQMIYTAGIYLKFQKYEKDNDDRTSFMDFQKSYNNFLVSFGILFEKHINNWNTAGKYGDGIEDQIGYTMYGFYKQTFRLMKQANVIETMYHKYLADKSIAEETGKEASMVDAFYYAMEKHYQGFMIFNAMQKMDDLHNTAQTGSNLGILGVGPNTEEENLLNELTGGKQFSSFKDKDVMSLFLNGLFSNGNLLNNLFTNNKMMNNQVAISIAKELNNSIHNNNPNLHNLLTGGSIGQEYKLESLLGEGKKVNDVDKNIISELWQHAVLSKDYFDLDENGRRNLVNKKTGKKFEESAFSTHLENQIDEELAKHGLTFKDLFVKNPDADRGDLKQMVVMQMKLNISTPTMISYILNKEYMEQRKDLAKKIGTKSPGEKYKKLSDEQDIKLKRDILLKYQDKFNLDRETVNKIVQLDVRKNHSKTLENIETTFRSGNFMDDNLFKLMHTDYLVHRVMAEGDTSVSSLRTKYALAYSGFPKNETSVKVMLDHLQEMENLPWKDKKEKLAHQAAMIYGMGKTYNYFSNSKQFQEMTAGGQKLLANWMYKISSDSIDYDSNSPTSQMNYRSSYRSGVGQFKPRYQTKAFSGQRPNFSKQFQPMRDKMSGQNMVEADPNAFINKMNQSKQKQSAPYIKEANPFFYKIQQHKMPEMIEYTRYFINAKVNNYYKPQEDNTYKEEKDKKPVARKMRITKPKKSKKPKTEKVIGRKPPKHYSRGVRPNLPFSNYEG